MKVVRKTLLAAAAVSLVIVAVITGAVVGTQKKNAKSASNVRGSALTDGTAPGADVVTPPPDTICEGEVCGKLCCTAAETCSLETIIDATGDTQMFASCKNVSADNLPDDDTVIGPAKPTPAPIKKAELNASLTAAPVDGAVQRQVDVGVWEGVAPSYQQRETMYDLKWDHLLRFQKIQNMDYESLKPDLADGKKIILNMEFWEEYANCADIAEGKYDQLMLDFAVQIMADRKPTSPPFYIRTLHEQNGNWYSWGLLYTDKNGNTNTLANYEKAWRRVIDVFASVGAVPQTVIHWQLNINNVNGHDQNQLTFKDNFWPASIIPDLSMVGITAYNRAFGLPGKDYSLTFDQTFENAYNQIAALTDKPLFVAEMATMSCYKDRCVDKPLWLTEAWELIATKYTRIVQVTWFLEQKTEDNIFLTWDITAPADIAAFTAGYNRMKDLTSPVAPKLRQLRGETVTEETLTV